MKLHELNKTQSKSKKRIGRGMGSGKGKTSGRGTKGQKARGKIPPAFSGGLALYRRLPLKRGYSNPKISSKPKIITLDKLNIFKQNSVVDLPSLIELGIITKQEALKGVKILSKGEITKALTIKLPLSKSALQKIEKSGGKVE